MNLVEHINCRLATLKAAREKRAWEEAIRREREAFHRWCAAEDRAHALHAAFDAAVAAVAEGRRS